MTKLSIDEARRAIEDRTILRFCLDGSNLELVLVRLLEPESTLTGHATAIAYFQTNTGLASLPTPVDLEEEEFLGAIGTWNGGPLPANTPELEETAKLALLPNL